MRITMYWREKQISWWALTIQSLISYPMRKESSLLLKMKMWRKIPSKTIRSITTIYSRSFRNFLSKKWRVVWRIQDAIHHQRISSLPSSSLWRRKRWKSQRSKIMPSLSREGILVPRTNLIRENSTTWIKKWLTRVRQLPWSCLWRNISFRNQPGRRLRIKRVLKATPNS